MWVDPEIISPEVGKKYVCLIHHYMLPMGTMCGEVYNMSGFFVCEGNIALNRIKNWEDIYAYES